MVIFTLIAAATAALVGFVPIVIVGESLPGTPLTPAVPGTQTARFPGGAIRYQEAGQGEHAILFLHGFNGHLGQWDGVWRELQGCACRRIRIDLPGFGGSTWSTERVRRRASRPTGWSPCSTGWAWTPSTLVGTSMGGSVAAAIAADHPDRVRRPRARGAVGLSGVARPVGGVRHGWRGPGLPNRAATLIAKSPLFGLLYPNSRALPALTVTATYGKRWSDLLARVRAPTLIVWARGDQTTPYAFAAPVQQAIAGSQLLSLDASTGHLVPAERPAAGGAQHRADGPGRRAPTRWRPCCPTGSCGRAKGRQWADGDRRGRSPPVMDKAPHPPGFRALIVGSICWRTAEM